MLLKGKGLTQRRRIPSLRRLKELFAPVFEKGGAQRAIVFGSYARGDADEYSDIDLIIVAPSTRHFLDRYLDFWGLWEVSPVKALQVLVYTTEEFAHMQEEGNSFIPRAVEEGKVIYEASAPKRGPKVASPGRKRSG